MAYLKTQYQYEGKGYEYTFYDAFKQEAIIYDKNTRIAPWFMNPELVKDMLAEKHSSRFSDPDAHRVVCLGSDITLLTMHIG